MDGNGRWAKQHQLARTQGHAEGVKRVEEIVSYARHIGIEVLTLFAFSTENWSRPAEEVSVLMRLFINALGQKAKELRANGINIRFGMIDPHWMAASCIDEAIRHIIAIGGSLDRIALLELRRGLMSAASPGPSV